MDATSKKASNSGWITYHSSAACTVQEIVCHFCLRNISFKKPISRQGQVVEYVALHKLFNIPQHL